MKDEGRRTKDECKMTASHEVLASDFWLLTSDFGLRTSDYTFCKSTYRVSAFSNLARESRKMSSIPEWVGPLRCLATMISATLRLLVSFSYKSARWMNMTMSESCSSDPDS